MVQNVQLPVMVDGMASKCYKKYNITLVLANLA